MPLSARDVEAKGKELLKAQASSTASPATILSLLDDLRTGVVASAELLRTTKIGMTVNRLKQHPDNGVKRAAVELVSKWKTDVRGSASTGSGTASGASTPRPGAPAVKNGTSPASRTSSPAVAAGKAKLSVPKEKRNAKEDGVDWKITGNVTRDSCVKLMYDGLAFMSEESPDDILRVAKAVETAAYDAYKPEASPAYRDKMRSLFQNLKNKSNQALRTNVYSGVVPPDKFVRMSHDELRSQERQAADKALEQENMHNAVMAQEEKSISTALQCGKCGMKKVSYTQAQTRSADEPMTTFCECLNCGKRWKFS